MITHEVIANGKKFRLILTDQSIMDAKRLKSLYNATYEDPESFEEVSSAISNTITQLSTAVEPAVSDSDLDGVIQAIMRIVDEKSRETSEAKSKQDEPAKRKTSSKLQASKKTKRHRS